MTWFDCVGMTRLGTLATVAWLPGAPLFLVARVGAGPCDSTPLTKIKSRDTLIQTRRNTSSASDPRLLEPRFHSTINVSIISASYPFPRSRLEALQSSRVGFWVRRGYFSLQRLQDIFQVHCTFQWAAHRENMPLLPLICLQRYRSTQTRDMQRIAIIQHNLAFTSNVDHPPACQN